MAAISSEGSLCARIGERIAKTVGPRLYSMWFDGKARFELNDDGDELGVLVPNSYVAEKIGRRFDAQVREAASAELGRDVVVRVAVREDCVAGAVLSTPATEASDASTEGETPGDGSPSRAVDSSHASVVASSAVQAVRAPSSAPLVARRANLAGGASRPPLRHSFDEFIVGPSNELAAAAARRLAEEDAQTHAPLFIHGGCGLGKTHLLQAICRRVLELKPGAAVLYTTGEQFTNEFLAAVRSNRIDEFRRRVRGLDVLAVDDVHFIANKQATQQEFLHSFDAIELGGARVVLASDSHPKLIQQFSAALVSRCVRGMVVEVRQPDTQTRAKIVRSLAERRGIPLMDTVIDVLARRCAGSVRELEGALTKIHALASLSRLRRNTGESQGDAAAEMAPIGHTLINHFFDGQSEPAPRRAVHVDHILDAVADLTAVPRTQIVGSSRQAHVVVARSLAIHLARQMTTMSYPEIALALGRRNHSTVITAAQRMEKQLAADPLVRLPGAEHPAHLSELLQRVKSKLTGA